MPVGPCSEGGRPGYRCGEAGKCYTYTPGDDAGRAEAKQSAIDQCLAMDEEPSADADTFIDELAAAFRQPVYDTFDNVARRSPSDGRELLTLYAAAPVVTINRLAALGARRAAQLEDRLAALLLPLLIREGNRAARRFTALAEAATASLTAAADWSPPLASELVDVEELTRGLRGKTDPVRRAAIENMMGEILEGNGISFDVTNPHARQILETSGAKVTHIAETTRENVRRAVAAAYEQGFSIDDTAKAIRRGMREASVARARMIARTELVNAVNGASLAAVKIVDAHSGSRHLKQWLTAPGAPHPRHELYPDLDGQTVGMDEFFNVGGYDLSYPGDPNGPPEEVINCRCSLVYVEQDEAAAAPAPAGSVPDREAAGPGRPDVRFAETTDYDAFNRALAENPRQEFLTFHTPEELAAGHAFLSQDGKAGFVLDPQGDLQNVFRNPGGVPGAGRAAVETAVARGALTLDAYDGFLPDLYQQVGFREVGRMKFVDEYAPDGWDYDQYGRPDVVFMSHGADEVKGRRFTDWDEAKRVSREAARPVALQAPRQAPVPLPVGLADPSRSLGMRPWLHLKDEQVARKLRDTDAELRTSEDISRVIQLKALRSELRNEQLYRAGRPEPRPWEHLKDSSLKRKTRLTRANIAEAISENDALAQRDLLAQLERERELRAGTATRVGTGTPRRTGQAAQAQAEAAQASVDARTLDPAVPSDPHTLLNAAKLPVSDPRALQPGVLYRAEPGWTHVSSFGTYVAKAGWVVRTNKSKIPVFIEDSNFPPAAAFDNLDLWMGDANAVTPGLKESVEKNTKVIEILAGKSPDDAFLSRIHDRDFEAAGTFGDGGRLTFWRGGTQDIASGYRETLYHEMGHAAGGPLDEAAWKAAQSADKGTTSGILKNDYTAPGYGGASRPWQRYWDMGKRDITDYGSTNLKEDWAESVKFYLLDKIGRLRFGTFTEPDGTVVSDARFADLWPARAQLIEDWLRHGGDIPATGVS